MPDGQQQKQVSMRECAESCNECKSVCERTLAHCLSQGGDHVAEGHIKLMLDCIDACGTCGSMCDREGDHCVSMCRTCAGICRACADSCDALGGQQMKECAEACRRCAEHCEAMAA